MLVILVWNCECSCTKWYCEFVIWKHLHTLQGLRNYIIMVNKTNAQFLFSCMFSLRKKKSLLFFLSGLLIAQIQSIKTGLLTTHSLRLNNWCFMLLFDFLIFNHIHKQNTHTFWYPTKYSLVVQIGFYVILHMSVPRSLFLENHTHIL